MNNGNIYNDGDEITSLTTAMESGRPSYDGYRRYAVDSKDGFRYHFYRFTSAGMRQEGEAYNALFFDPDVAICSFLAHFIAYQDIEKNAAIYWRCKPIMNIGKIKIMDDFDHGQVDRKIYNVRARFLLSTKDLLTSKEMNDDQRSI